MSGHLPMSLYALLCESDNEFHFHSLIQTIRYVVAHRQLEIRGLVQAYFSAYEPSYIRIQWPLDPYLRFKPYDGWNWEHAKHSCLHL